MSWILPLKKYILPDWLSSEGQHRFTVGFSEGSFSDPIIITFDSRPPKVAIRLRNGDNEGEKVIEGVAREGTLDQPGQIYVDLFIRSDEEEEPFTLPLEPRKSFGRDGLYYHEFSVRVENLPAYTEADVGYGSPFFAIRLRDQAGKEYYNVMSYAQFMAPGDQDFGNVDSTFVAMKPVSNDFEQNIGVINFQVLSKAPMAGNKKIGLHVTAHIGFNRLEWEGGQLGLGNPTTIVLGNGERLAAVATNYFVHVAPQGVVRYRVLQEGNDGTVYESDEVRVEPAVPKELTLAGIKPEFLPERTLPRDPLTEISLKDNIKARDPSSPENSRVRSAGSPPRGTRPYVPEVAPAAVVNLSKPLGWPTSGVWNDGVLLVTDTVLGGIVRIDPRGIVAAWSEGGENFSLIKPTRAGRGEDAFMLYRYRENVYGSSTMAFMDADLRLGMTTLVEGVGASFSYDIGPIFDFANVGEGFLAFGLLRKMGDSPWRASFYQLGENFFRVYMSMPMDDLVAQYLTTVPVVVSVEDDVYFQATDPRLDLAVWERRTAVARRLGFPEDLRRDWDQTVHEWRSSVRELKLGTAVEFYRMVETSRMPLGLFSWRDKLYVLSKDFIDMNGDTRWRLIRLNPQDGSELFRVELPTRAAHLFVVPGEMWAFVERGPVERGRNGQPLMKTKSMVLIPALHLDGP